MKKQNNIKNIIETLKVNTNIDLKHDTTRNTTNN